MNISLKTLVISGVLLLGLSYGGYKMFFSSACCSSSSSETSGCSPSSCRGAKTKFGEAQVISDLRLNLIDLKSDMEQSTDPSFDPQSYDIHGIVGESDDESLQIIIREVKLVETAFAKKMDHSETDFTLPHNKAKQIEYLDSRIEQLRKLL